MATNTMAGTVIAHRSSVNTAWNDWGTAVCTVGQHYSLNNFYVYCMRVHTPAFVGVSQSITITVSANQYAGSKYTYVPLHWALCSSDANRNMYVGTFGDVTGDNTQLAAGSYGFNLTSAITSYPITIATTQVQPDTDYYFFMWPGNSSYMSARYGGAACSVTSLYQKSSVVAENGTLGVEQTLTVTRENDAFTHSISYTCGEVTGTICENSSVTSFQFTPPIDLAAQNTTGTEVAIVFSIITYDGESSLGESTTSISCSIPDSVVPSCSLVITDQTGYSNTYGAMIKNRSKINIQVSATEAYGSAITLYEISANGVKYNAASAVTDVLKTAGTLTVEAKVTDGRGRSGTVAMEVTVLDYSNPSITLFKNSRCNSDGTANDAGEYAKITFSGVASPLNNHNNVSYKLEYRKQILATYTTVYLIDYDDNYSVTEGSYIFPAESGSSYEVKLTLLDDFTSDTKSIPLSTATTIMHWKANGKGMGIGKVGEADSTLDMGWDIRMNGNKLTGLPTPTEDSDAVPKSYAVPPTLISADYTVATDADRDSTIMSVYASMPNKSMKHVNISVNGRVRQYTLYRTDGSYGCVVSYSYGSGAEIHSANIYGGTMYRWSKVNNLSATDVGALPTTGGTLTGNLILTENVHYGTVLPSSAVEGQIFILIGG